MSLMVPMLAKNALSAALARSWLAVHTCRLNLRDHPCPFPTPRLTVGPNGAWPPSATSKRSGPAAARDRVGARRVPPRRRRRKPRRRRLPPGGHRRPRGRAAGRVPVARPGPGPVAWRAAERSRMPRRTSGADGAARRAGGGRARVRGGRRRDGPPRRRVSAAARPAASAPAARTAARPVHPRHGQSRRPGWRAARLRQDPQPAGSASAGTSRARRPSPRPTRPRR